jgi:hypothetical protein
MKSLLLSVLLLAVPVAAQEAPFDWKFHPAVGSKWHVRTFVRTVTTQNAPADLMGGSSIGVTNVYTKSVTADYDVLSIDSQGTVTAQLIYRSYVENTDGSANGTRLPKADQQTMARALKSLNESYIGTKLTVQISPKGQILDIQGLESLRRKLGISPTSPTSTDRDLKYFISDESFRNLVGLEGQIPSLPVSGGEYYSNGFTINNLAILTPLNLSGTRTLKSRASGTAKFVESGAVSLYSFNLYPGSHYFRAPAEGQGTFQGNSTVDEASGLIKTSHLNLRFEGRITTIGKGRSATKAVIPIWGTEEHYVVITPRD